MKYTNFLRKIVTAYINIGFRPNNNVFFDPENLECDPLVAIAIYEAGLDKFRNKWRFWNEMGIYHWITKYFNGNYGWVEGFRRGFNLEDRKHGWSKVSFEGGYRVGREVRRRLKEIYYKKQSPRSLEEIEW